MIEPDDIRHASNAKCAPVPLQARASQTLFLFALLGLSLAKIAMDEMKGSLSIEATEGESTTVTLKFPRVQSS